ncbi:uncharacterized protein PFL1_00437 [Pseudozyma flocculosa PF-1]|uniref:Related to cathepsin d (Lysosomal aspartyl protease) n=1 Tax=Pseudozyma flocculosa TaxID=84751 RepID=A0A5C3ESH3_9BASI|nr:uncharacterized protein PFL1_00437 [Pseudozyma flocculosa PF-1]EPQ32240.1 hypothetical protein PFL1_00437 [Pseudozyma flocculosa PF-1]SPO34810.1 related to cathepsin d (lysosomal aspartyl protease) [Pseudozyma flocculosa]
MHPSALLAVSLGVAAGLAPTASGYVMPFQRQQDRIEDLNSFAANHGPLRLSPRGIADEPQAVGYNAERRSFSVPLQRRHGDLHPDISKRDPEKTMAWAFRQGERMRHKYNKGLKTDDESEKQRRQTIGLTDVGQDSYYYAQVSLGTPKQNFNIILDTGSADFWVVDSVCGPSDNCDSDLNRYNPSASSSHIGSSADFQVSYGTGAVQGSLAADTASLAGYTVFNLTFAQADRIAQDTIESPASGIMGMGFQSLASSGATPFWQVLAQQGVLKTNAFTFQLARNIDNVDVSSPDVNSVLSPGGVFTLGEIDANQYSGDITYVDIPNNLERTQGLGYWSIPMDGISVNGQKANIGNGPLAAIDTGTTLIGGPQSQVRAVYSLIPGAQSAPGSSGYYLFPCDANLDIELTFGGRAFKMSTVDMNLGPYPYTISRNCLGALFDIDLGGRGVYGVPEWIVGDAFLKNVFSVYDGNGRVGFANLKGSEAQSAAITTGAVPSGTAAQTARPAASTSSVDTDGGGLPVPSLQTGSRGASANGLPTPSASGGVTGGAANLIPGGSGRGGGSSGASSLRAISATSIGLGAAVAAMMAGAAFVL